MTRQNEISTASIGQWIFEFSTFGLLTTDRALKITGMNRWFERTGHLNNQDLLGRDLMECFPEIGKRNLGHYFQEALHGGSSILSQKLHHYLFQLPSPIEQDHGFMQQVARISPQINQEEVTGIIIQIEDVTERVKRELELSLANKELINLNSTKDKFFHIVSHDLRAPFNALVGLSQILRDDQELSADKTRKIVEALNNSIKNQYTFLENLLQWAQLQSDGYEIRPEAVTMNEIIEAVRQIVNASAENKQIKILTNIPEHLSLITDKQALTTVLYNLVFNAIKFTHPGGSIEIRAVPDEEQVMIFIKDTGIGMSEESISKLFRIEETFTTPGTNKEKGSGLGLILCKELLGKLGGEIWVESTPGKGSTFFIRLPGLPVHQKS